MAIRPDGSLANAPGWRVRVVPNGYPAVVLEEEAAADDHESPHPTRERAPGYGSHEVVIESPDHEASMAVRPVEDLFGTLKVYRERLRALRGDRRLRHVQIFKNSGHAAGATRHHPHSQIVATTILPPAVAAMLRSFEEYGRKWHRCLVCERVERELGDRHRLVHASEEYVAFCPYASRLPFETCVAPIDHRQDYAASSEEELGALARVLRRAMSALESTVEDFSFNLILHTTPHQYHDGRGASAAATVEVDFHWHFEILPRTTNIAGLEWGAGIYINHVAPEVAASRLREAL